MSERDRDQREENRADGTDPLAERPGAAARAELLGRRVGPFRVVRLIGEGGMGLVYEAVHEGLGQRAAIKVLRPELTARPELLRRFFNEARAAALVEHPGLLRIHDVGEIAGLGGGAGRTAYILMEYLAGESLRARLRRTGGRLPLPEALRIGRQLASALSAAHGAGVVHRDVKPDNVIIAPDPEAEGGERARLLDFGIARLPPGERDAEAGVLTRPGVLLGSPRYMAPEQAGGGPLDDRADVYALGVVLHEAVSGRPPFRASHSDELILKHISEPPPPLRTCDPSLPEALEALVLRMLAKDPGDRPRMEEVARRLGALGGARADAEPARLEGAPTLALPAERPRPGLPQASRLEQLVEEELQRAPAPGVPTAAGPVPRLSAKRFQDIITAFLLHDGERYCLRGTVLRQRGVSLPEARVLVTDCGVGARFLVELGGPGGADGPDGGPFFVTIYTVLPAHTRLLQDHLERREAVTLVVRVLAARPEAAAAPGEAFRGFALFGSQTSHPWALVVDEVLRG